MNKNTIDLSQLRDIHLPIEPSWWPLAPGWYILTGILMIIIIGIILIYKHHQNQPIPYALKELKKLMNQQNQSYKLLSQLLKRVAMVKYGRKEIAPLVEDKWQNFILATAPNTFTKQQAHDIAYAIYEAKDKTLSPALYTAGQKWIKTVLKNKQ